MPTFDDEGDRERERERARERNRERERDREQANGWGEYRVYVVKELERLNLEFDNVGDELKRRLDRIEAEITNLKIKSAFWGGMGSAAVIVIKYFITGGK